MQADSPILSAKRAIRALMHQLRRHAHQQTGAAMAKQLAAQAGLLAQTGLLDQIAGRVVAGYSPIGDEADVTLLMDALGHMGAILALPVVVGKDQPLIFRRFDAATLCEQGPLGTRHPPATSPQLRPDLVLVPLLAYDRAGFRLGYGRGFYDRTLQALGQGGGCCSVGIAFAVQEVDRVPCEGHDRRLNAILTENGLIMPEDV